jgi:hypothetical protein
MLTQGHSVLDGAYSGMLAAMLVPKASIENATWQSTDKGVANPPDWDGIMMIRREGGATTGTIFYLSDGKLQSRVPADYLGVALR